MPEMIPVKSSNLSAIGYDPDLHELTVLFTTGAKYVYEGVSAEVHRTLMEAESVGRYFMQNVKGKFDTRKVG